MKTVSGNYLTGKKLTRANKNIVIKSLVGWGRLAQSGEHPPTTPAICIQIQLKTSFQLKTYYCICCKNGPPRIVGEEYDPLIKKVG